MTTVAEVADGLGRLRDIGYGGVEAGGVPLLEGPDPEISARELKRMLDDAGLTCVGAHARWREIRDDTSAVIDRLQELDCPIISVPAFVDEFDRFEPASYATFAGEAALVTQILGEHGIRLGYHHHAHEFLRFGPDRRDDVRCADRRTKPGHRDRRLLGGVRRRGPRGPDRRPVRTGAAAALQGPRNDPRRRGRRAPLLCARSERATWTGTASWPPAKPPGPRRGSSSRTSACETRSTVCDPVSTFCKRAFRRLVIDAACA